MAAHNGPDGYGWVSKTLHWGTVLAVAAQFTVGLTMDADDSGRGRGRGRGGESGHGRGRGGDEAYLADPETLVRVHVVLGVAILVLAATRVLWRRWSGLPPWSEHLSDRQRRVAHWTERALLTMLFVMPASGLLLFGVGEDDLLAVHVTSHVLFLLALVVHLSTNLRPRILRRML